MKYFKNSSNHIFAYEDGDNVPDGMTLLSKSEVAEIEAPVPLTRADIEQLRRSAYAHPITGSDRFMPEAEAERISGNTEKSEAVEAMWLQRRIEISEQYPWPKDSK